MSLDLNAIKSSYNNVSSARKSEARKFLEQQGREFDKNGNTVVDLIIETNNGKKNLGKVTYSAYKAIENNTLDSYKPKNAEEKKTIENYKKLNSSKTNPLSNTSPYKIGMPSLNTVIEASKNSSGNKSSNTTNQENEFENQPSVKAIKDKYGLNVSNLTYDDITKWAKEHNFTFSPRVDNSTKNELIPNKDGLWGMWGNDLPTEEEKKDAETILALFELSASNRRNEKTQSKAEGAIEGFTTSFVKTLPLSELAIKKGDEYVKKNLEDVGIDAKYYTPERIRLDKVEGEHPIASTLGTLTGIGAQIYAGSGLLKGTGVTSAMSSSVQSYKNILNAGKALGATKGAIRTAKLARALPTIMTMATPAVSTAIRQKSKGIDNVSNDIKDTPIEWLEKQVAAGNAQYTKGLASSLDFILPTEALGKYDLISKVNDYYNDTLKSFSLEAQQSSSNLGGKGWETAGEAIQVITAALPNSITALFLAGANVPGQAVQFSSNKTINAVANYLMHTAKNPQYWTSILQTLGTDYEEAKSRGANDAVATAYAVFVSAINAGIELGGFQALPDKLMGELAEDTAKRTFAKGFFDWLTSSFEEGGEEVLQSFVSNVVAKIFDHETKWVSETDDKAVVNLSRTAKEFGMGMFAGMVLSGGQIAAVKTIERGNISRVGNYMQDFKDEVIAVGLSSPQDTESYKIAQKLSKKKGEISDYELGKLHIANTEQFKSVSVGDKFKDTKTGNTVKVVSRDDTNTTVEIETPNGTSTKEIPNQKVESFVESGQIEKIESVPTDEAFTDYESEEAELMATDMSEDGVANVKVGDVFTADGETFTITDRDNTHTTFTVSNENGNVIRKERVENDTADINFSKKGKLYTGVEVGDVYRNNHSGITYTVVSRDSKETKLRNNQNSKIITMTNETADSVFAYDDAYTKVQYGNNVTTTETKNEPTTKETVTTNKETPTDVVDSSDAIVSGVVDAITETLKPGAEESIFKAMEKKGFKGDLVTFAKALRKSYKQRGKLGAFADYFTDNGAKVVSAIESTMDVADANVEPTVSKMENVGQLFEDYSGTVDDIISVSDDTAKDLADKRVAVEVLKNTPAIILDNVEDARDLKVIINYNKLYLAVRKDGVFKGHYHNLGVEIAKKLPDFLKTPDAIIQLKNGRLNLFATVKTERGNNGIVSVELNSTKDINGKYDDYNVVVTMFSSDDNYAQNLISGEGVTLKYKKEDLPQVNPQLYKWLAIINDKSSTNNISHDNNTVNSVPKNEAHETLTNQAKSDNVKENDIKDTSEKRHTTAYTNDNEKIDLLFKVVSVDDLIVSNGIDGKVNPNYPQELQPRDRSRVSSQNQIRQMANNLNPARLADSTNVSDGSPIVGADNVVESGNGRILAIELAYKMGTADEYKNYIINNAEKYGIDVSNLPEKPVLIRERVTAVDRIEFTRKANESSISSLSATEQAKVDAENLTEDVLNLLVPNDEGIINTSDNKNFIYAVISKVFNNEDLNNVVGAEGRLSARGLERITNAIFYKAYGDISLSVRLSESLDNDMKNATKVLLNIAPKVVVIKNGIVSEHFYNFNFSEDIASAVRLFEKCRTENKKIEEYASQTSFIEKESPLVTAMAYVFETKNRGAKQATDFYNLLLDTVIEMGDPHQLSMETVEVFQSKEEILNATLEKFNNGVEPTNTIAIPENIYKPQSAEGREDDRRGVQAIFGDNTSKIQNDTNETRIQQDNGQSEETRTVADDKRLRKTDGRTKGKSEVTGIEQQKEGKTQYDVAFFEKLGSDIRKGENVSLEEVKNAIDALLLNHGESLKAELSQLKNDELKKRISIYDRGRITKKTEMVDSIYTDMLSSLYYALSGKDTITYIYDGTGFEAQQSKMLSDISRELTEETFNKRLAENAEKYKKQVAAKEEKLAKVKNPQTLEDYAYKKRYFGLSDEETIQYENLYAEERKKAREGKKAAKTTKDTSGAETFFANADNYTIEKTAHTKTGDDVWVVRPANRLETEEWKKLNEQMKALGGSYWRGNQGWNFKKDPTAALTSTEEAETETVKGSTNAEKLRNVADSMQKAIDDKFRDRLTNTAKRAREAANAEAEGERLKQLQDTINNIAETLENGENTLLDKIDSKAQVETLMNMLRTSRRNRISETLSDASYDERSKEQDKPYSNDDAKYAEYPLTKLHENIVSGYLRAAEGKTGYKQISDRLKKAIKNAKNGYVAIDTQLFSDIDKIVKNLSPFYEQLWNDGVAERKRLARMGIENVVELRAYLREFIDYLPGRDTETERQRTIKAKERQLANSKIEGFFPTPKAIVEQMLDEANIQPGETVLEPSAGKGNIADEIKAKYPDNSLDVVEWNASLNELLSEKGHNVVGEDFLKTSTTYDKIIMNPPFEKGQDIDHIRHAYSLLNNGGRVVCIMSEGPFFRSDKKATEFREWLDSLGGVSEKLPEGAFKSSERSTGVNTRLVVIDKTTSTLEDVKYSLESGKNYEREGNLLHDDSKQRYAREYTGEQVASLVKAAESGSGTAEERKRYTARLNPNKLDKKVITDKDGIKHMFTEIKSSAWNGQMNKIADYYAQKDVNVHFIKGGVQIAFVGEDKTANAMRIGNEIYISYDNSWYTPEQLSMHEYIHIKYGSPEFQKIVQDILEALPKREYNKLVDKVKKAYGDIIENPYKYEEELICDILSGMTPSSLLKSGEIVLKFWARENADMLGYDTSLYADSIDAGGVIDNIGYGENDIAINIQNDDIFVIDEKDMLLDDRLQLSNVVMQAQSPFIEKGMTLPQTQYSYTNDYFVAWENTGHGDYKFGFAIWLNNDTKELINKVRGGIKDGTYSSTRGFNSWTLDIQSRRKSDSGYNSNTAKTGTYGNDDRLPSKASESNTVGYNAGNKEYSVENKIDYSLEGDDIPDFLELWEEYIAEYGVIPKGENFTRDIDVPQKISEKDVVSRFARTMLEAGVTPDWAVSEFEQAIINGEMTHEVITNKYAQDWAKKQIEYHGFDDALNQWTVLSESGKVGKNELALGMELYNQCVTNKDVHNAMKLAAELAAEATRAGQTLQACRMLKLMTPDGQLYYLEKSIQKINDEFMTKLADKFEGIELNEELMERFLNEDNEEKRNAIYDDICQDIADQIPSTLIDKWNSWRYLAMLGNPRTHMRNIFGNAVFIPAVRIKNYIGAVIERVAKVDVSERTKSSRKSKEAIEFAKIDFEEMTKVLQGENAKYAITSDIEGKRTIFKTELLEKVRLKNFEFLEKEDMWFLKMHYVDALARLITVRNIDTNTIDKKTLEKARAIAIKEAQAATYRDANSIAEGLNVLQRKLERSNNKALRTTSVLIEGVMPFKKTPLNIAKQGINYSPIGILKGVYKAFTKLKDGSSTTTEVIDDFAKGLTGTAMMLLGYFLAKMGLLLAAGDKPDKEKEFDKMVGEQDYSFNIWGKSYTIDWAAPSNLSLFIGAELYKLTKDEFKFADVVSAISTITEPLLELSVFNGVNGVIESAQYSEGSPLLAIGSDMATSYLMQALPTIGGQISRIIDENKREYYYVDKNKNIPKGMQRLIGQASSKIPFASKLFEVAVDEWGREETYGDVFERVLENTVSPGYYSEENYTKVDKVLKDLYEKTGETSVLPISQQKYYEENYIRYDMTAKEYTEAKKMRGQKSFEYVSNLLAGKIMVKLKDEKTGKYKTLKYSQMSDSEKVKAIKKCYEQAGDETKEAMLKKMRNRKAAK